MKVKITTLIENHEDDQHQLKYEHGLSMLIETSRQKILFDTGVSGDFIDNAKRLNVDLSDIDYCVISHGHYDHAGGYRKYVENSEMQCPLFVGSKFFNTKYRFEKGEYSINGIDFDEKLLMEKGVPIIKISDDTTNFHPSFTIFKNFIKSNDFEEIENRFYLKDGDTYVKDDFRDEIVLGINTTKGIILVVGCSHIGIVNIIESIKKRTKLPIRAVIGGTHLNKADDNRIQKTIEYLKSLNLELLATSHCTGDKAMGMFKEAMPEVFELNNTGHIIEL